MISSKQYRELIKQASMRASKVRAEFGLSILAPTPIYDLTERRGLDIRFQKYSSIEGAYTPNSLPPTIVISSLRPAGRQAFTCAHELGHHVLGHGMRYDELMETGSDEPEEILANAFASSLLMPISAVQNSFTVRKWDPRSCTALQAYTIAGWLGVG